MKAKLIAGAKVDAAGRDTLNPHNKKSDPVSWEWWNKGFDEASVGV